MMPDEEYGYDLVIYSRIQGNVLNNTNTLVPKSQAVAVSIDSQYVFSSANDQFKIIRLFKDYPNTKIFSHWNNSRDTYEHNSKIIYAAASKYQDILFIGTQKTFDIVNISSKITISSYPLNERLFSFQISNDEKLVYLRLRTTFQILHP